jgi:hypothetical protein
VVVLALAGCDVGGGAGACGSSSDCPDGQLCVSGTCRTVGGGGGCTSDVQCGADQRCEGGRCVAAADECQRDTDCTAQPGGTCTDGACSYPLPVGCQSDADCPGQICDRDTGECEAAPDVCAGGCDDGDPCTVDACEAAGCAHEPVPGCCASDGACDDGDPCTTDTCAANVCTHAPAGGPGCCREDGECDDADPDTVDRCTNGRCEHLQPCSAAAECDDGDRCTIDGCADGGCRHERVVGCCTTGGDCNDGDPCTADRCVAGGCQYTVAPGCCTADADCEDGNPCTTNTCSAEAVCEIAPVPGCCTDAGDCDDGNRCTQDACGAGGSCRNTPVPGCCRSDIDCNDGLPCTADTCTPEGTCTNAWVPHCCTAAADCDDRDPCTIDTCGAGGLCANAPIPGCCDAAADCDDGDPCTSDRCNASVCESLPIAGCCTSDAECNDGNACTQDRCSGNVCRHTTVDGCCRADADCDDGIPATVDTCDAARVCHHVLRGTCASAAECDDADPCTQDRCEASACAWYLVTDEACRCALESDCEPEEVCSLAQLEDGGIWGYCFQTDGTLPMGSVCDPESTTAVCESGICLELMGTYVCFGACGATAECAGGATCGQLPLPSGGGAADHQMNVCVPPPIACVDDAGCPADMYCDGFTLAGAPAALVLGCLYADETKKRTGQPCAADEECNSGFCLPDETRGGICWGLCDGDSDCRVGQRCYDDLVSLTLSLGTPSTADDVVVRLPACAWDFGSLDPCTRESQCPGAEVCFPLLNATDTAFAPACLLPDASATVPPGGACSTNAQCQTAVCVSGLFSDRCLQFCTSGGDCTAPLTCEAVTFTLTNDDGSVTNLFANVCVD